MIGLYNMGVMGEDLHPLKPDPNHWTVDTFVPPDQKYPSFFVCSVLLTQIQSLIFF